MHRTAKLLVALLCWLAFVEARGEDPPPRDRKQQRLRGSDRPAPPAGARRDAAETGRRHAPSGYGAARGTGALKRNRVRGSGQATEAAPAEKRSPKPSRTR